MNNIIIFDMDGILIDSKKAHAAAFNLAFEKNNLCTFSEQKLISLFGPPSSKIIKTLFPKITVRKLRNVVDDKREFLLEKTFKETKGIPGAASALFELKKYFKLALVTNAQHGEIYQLLQAGGIDARLFDVMLGAEDISKPKPSPDAIYKVESFLKGRVRWVVGDQLEDVKSAKAAQVKSVCVDSGIDDLDDLSDAGADIIIRDISLLPEIIL